MLPHLLDRPVSLVRCPSGRLDDSSSSAMSSTACRRRSGRSSSSESNDEDRTYIYVRGRGRLSGARTVRGGRNSTPGAAGWTSRTVRTECSSTSTRARACPGGEREARGAPASGGAAAARCSPRSSRPLVRKVIHLVVPIDAEARPGSRPTRPGKHRDEAGRDGAGHLHHHHGKNNRKSRIFIDYHRNARSATAVAAYSLRARPHLPASTPIAWRDLESIDSPADLNYSSLPGLLTTSGDPWADINESARDLAP